MLAGTLIQPDHTLQSQPGGRGIPGQWASAPQGESKELQWQTEQSTRGEPGTDDWHTFGRHVAVWCQDLVDMFVDEPVVQQAVSIVEPKQKSAKM